MAKNIVFGASAREQRLRGIDQVANVFAITLGPKGRNVAIDNGFGTPTVIHDGVTVASGIALPNAFQNMGTLRPASSLATAQPPRWFRKG